MIAERNLNLLSCARRTSGVSSSRLWGGTRRTRSKSNEDRAIVDGPENYKARNLLRALLALGRALLLLSGNQQSKRSSSPLSSIFAC